MQKLFGGLLDGLGAIVSFPATIQKMLWAVVIMGGIGILAITGSIAWSIGSGGVVAAKGVEAAGAIAARAIP